MATEKQIQANRNNAKHSAGPRTNQGKSRAAQNAASELPAGAAQPGSFPEPQKSLLMKNGETNPVSVNSNEINELTAVGSSQSYRAGSTSTLDRHRTPIEWLSLQQTTPPAP